MMLSGTVVPLHWNQRRLQQRGVSELEEIEVRRIWLFFDVVWVWVGLYGPTFFKRTYWTDPICITWK